MFQLRGSGSSNVLSRVPPPGMFIKSGAPIRFAIPMRSGDRPGKGSLLSSQSAQMYFKGGPQQQQYAGALKRPYAAPLTSPGVFKFTSPHKTAINFQSAPPVPLKSKPEYIYEKVNKPRFQEPFRYNQGSSGAIHTIPAPNLSLNDGQAIPELTANNLNSHFDSDLTKFSAQSFNHALERPVRHFARRCL